MRAKMLISAAVGVVAAAALSASPATAGTASVDCSTYEFSRTGAFGPWGEATPFSYFRTDGPTTFSYCVDVPETAEIIVDVSRFNVSSQEWETVLLAPSGPGDKAFSYNAATAGYYQLFIKGITSGTFVAGVTLHRG